MVPQSPNDILFDILRQYAVLDELPVHDFCWDRHVRFF